MKLDKAIEILELDKNCDYEGSSADLEAALQLGIEAMKRLREHRTEHIDITFRALPSETESR